MKSLLCISAIAFFGFASCKKESTTGPYFPQVKTIIQNNCMSCHASSGAWTGRPTKFDNDSDIVAGYTSIKASVADPVTYGNKRMPEGGTLSQADIDIIVKWFNLGGKATD